MDYPSFLAALAQSSGGAGGSGDFSKMMLFIGIMAFALWFVILRPQKRDQQKREQMISGLSKGDKVVTAGGIHGTVWNASSKDTVEVEVAPKIRLTFNRASISVIDQKKAGEANGETKGEARA